MSVAGHRFPARNPEPGDTRVQFGYVEVFESNRVGDGFWKPTREAVEGAREVSVYGMPFSYRDVVLKLAPNERIVGVEGLGNGNRMLWVVADDGA